MDEMFTFAAGVRENAYTRTRGAERLLTPGKDYAELPAFGRKSPRQIIASLAPGSRVLDVGCGTGQLGAEILGTAQWVLPGDPLYGAADNSTPTLPTPINPEVAVYGFDAQAQKGQDRLTSMIIGNIDNLSLQAFGQDFTGFDLVISSSVLYHLPDYWGSILRMANVLKPNGILLASTLPRVLYKNGEGHDEGAEGPWGYLYNPTEKSLFYFDEKNILDIHGNIIPPGRLIAILNRNNPNLSLTYSVASSTSDGATCFGGQLAGQRLSLKENLDLSNMYYYMYKDNLGYVVAQSPEEKATLEQKGYINIPSRLHNQKR